MGAQPAADLRRRASRCSSGRWSPARAGAARPSRSPRPARGIDRRDVHLAGARPSCSGCSTTAADVAALRRASTPCSSAAARSPRVRARAEAAGVRVVQTYGMARPAAAASTTASRSTGSRSRIGDGRPVLLAGRCSSTATTATRRGPPRCWTTAGSAPHDLGRSTTTAGCGSSAGVDDVVISGGRQRAGRRRSRRGSRAHPDVAAAGWSAYPTTSGGSGSSPFVVGDGSTLDEAARPGRRRAPRPGRPAQLVRRRRAAAAAQRQGRPAAARALAGRRSHEHRSSSIPLRTRFRGITVREGVLLRGRRRAGASSARSWSTTPRVAEPWLRCAVEAAAGGWPAPLRDRVPVNVTVPAVDAERAREIVLAGGLHDRQGQGRRARPDPGRRRGPARGGPRRARPGGPDPDRRQRRLVRRRGGRRDPGARPGGRRAGVRRAAVRLASRTWPPSAAASTCRSPPTSRSAAPRTPTGCATSRPPTSPCSRCSRSAGCAPACGSPRTSACPVVVSSALETSRRHRRRGRPGRRAARAAARLRAGDRAAAHRRRGRRPAAAGRRAAARRRARRSTRRALARLAAADRARTGGAAGRGRQDWPRPACGRIDRS